MTSATQLAHHLLWAAATPAAHDEAFNIVNGDIFRWNWLWPRLADWFGLQAAPFPATPQPLEVQMKDDAPLWREIAARHHLAETDLGRVASPWHTDADLGRPIECVTDMTKSRLLGFTGYESTPDAFFGLFAQMREARLIP